MSEVFYSYLSLRYGNYLHNFKASGVISICFISQQVYKERSLCVKEKSAKYVTNSGTLLPELT